MSWFERTSVSSAPSSLVYWPLFTTRSANVCVSDELSAFLRSAYRFSPLLVK